MNSNDQDSDAREEYYDRIAQKNLKPLWEVLRAMITPEPHSPEAAFIWHYDNVRSFLLEACRVISVAEADRRVLVLENPAFAGKSRATQSLFAGLQIILPGEVAPSHRHSPAALRLIVEGEGAYTAVESERTLMHPGDFVITPSWTWHSHGNEGDGPVIWLDGLDVPLVGFLNAVFFQDYEEPEFPVSRPEGDSLARYGSGILPVDYAPNGKTTPILNYPYERTRAALDAMSRGGAWDPCHGVKSRYVNPATGDYAMPTMGAFAQLLPRGFLGDSYRSTDSTVYAVIDGRGRTTIDGETFDWQPHDVFVVPGWRWHYHQATEEAMLFSFSDRPVQQKLGLWRDQRG
jgi:gentisate 1,2-dioxygenase